MTDDLAFLYIVHGSRLRTILISLDLKDIKDKFLDIGHRDLDFSSLWILRSIFTILKYIVKFLNQCFARLRYPKSVLNSRNLQ